VTVLKKVNQDFFKEWSKEMAYILGFFLADGTITTNKRGGKYFVLQISDKHLLYSIRAAMKSNHKISKREHKKFNSIFYRLQIGSKEICRDLNRLGVLEKKANRLVLPKIPKEYVGVFVRGYFDGDGNVWTGYVHKERKVKLLAIQTTFTSVSNSFLVDLRDVLTQIGINGAITCSKTYSRLSYSILPSIKLYKLMYSGCNDSLQLHRKRKVFEKFIEERELRS